MEEKTGSYKVKGEIEFDIIEITEEHAISKMLVKKEMLNPFGTVHAGALLWLADVTATSLLFKNAPNQFPVAVTLYTNLLSNLKEGEITAKSKITRRGKRISVVRTHLIGNSDQLLAEVITTHVQSPIQRP